MSSSSKSTSFELSKKSQLVLTHGEAYELFVTNN